MTQVAPSAPLLRRRLRVTGVVQGVGFRPFVHRLAQEMVLAGHVGNDAEGVFVEVEGPVGALDTFARRLTDEAPPLAHIFAVTVAGVPPLGERCFRVAPSVAGGTVRTYVSPDVAVCQACLEELFDPGDRRYRYPFVNCTDCGPRFTITLRLPYDRPNTTMAGFTMCAKCKAEYEDPRDRRFHAQPVACPACGPHLFFEQTAVGDAANPLEGDDALAAAQLALASGRIVAVKGIGGYHLACDATSDTSVAALRARKHRPTKPLAVMVRDLEAACRLALIDDAEARLLTSPQRPIVLLRRRVGGPIADGVAPHNPRVGVLLPYSPLHHLLFAPVPGAGAPAPEALVMTSGNLSEEPICYRDDDARRRLGQIADAWLVHDRPIHVPCDDSVTRLVDGEELAVRRSRGYAPLPIRLPWDSPPLLATGGELKNTFCLAAGREAWLSQHIGDMGSVETLSALEASVHQLCGLYDITPEVVAADLHPGYQIRRWAKARYEREGLTVNSVQHHHAHLAAVMAEHGLPPDDKVVGFVFDGTGYGTDGTVWGGEVLVGGYSEVERVSHLRSVPLLGGDAAVRKPYRMALAHLRAAGIAWAPDLPPAVTAVAAGELEALEYQLRRGVGCVATSSMGRLFDAVSALVGLCSVVTYEAQAAIELEMAAEAHLDGKAASLAPGGDYRFGWVGDEFDAAPVLTAIVGDMRAGSPPGPIAASFHRAVAHLIAEEAAMLCQRAATEVVVLGGGVFQNAVLLRLARAELVARHIRVLTARLIPPNDGGLALGQAAVVGCRQKKEP